MDLHLTVPAELRRIIGARMCALFGHGWRYEPQQHMHGGHAYGPFRVCDRCQDITLLYPPAPGHPESIDRELPHDQEVLLAARDAELFPDDIRDHR